MGNLAKLKADIELRREGGAPALLSGLTPYEIFELDCGAMSLQFGQTSTIVKRLSEVYERYGFSVTEAGCGWKITR